MGQWQDQKYCMDEKKSFPFDCSVNRFDENNLQDFHEVKRSLIFREVEKILLYKDSIDILDFGSGQGDLALDLKNYFGKKVNVWGYEVSPCAYAMALKHNSMHQQSVNFFLDESDLFDYTMGHRVFDLIVSRNFFHYTTKPVDIFTSFRRVLKADGLLLAFGDLAPIAVYSNNELKEFLKSSGFSQFDVFPFDPLRFSYSSKSFLKYIKNTNSKYCYLIRALSFLERPLSLNLFYPLKLHFARFYDDQSESSGCLVRAKV